MTKSHGIPTLSHEEIAVVHDYYREHQAELDEEDRQIRAHVAEQIRLQRLRFPAESREVRLARMKETLRQRQKERVYALFALVELQKCGPGNGPLLTPISMHRPRRKRRHAYRDILRAARLRCTVANPLAALDDYSLPRFHPVFAAASLHQKHPTKHHREFIKLRRLPWLDPSRGTDHFSDAHGVRPRVHVANKLVDNLRRLAVTWNPRRFGDDTHHWIALPILSPSTRITSPAPNSCQESLDMSPCP